MIQESSSDAWNYLPTSMTLSCISQNSFNYVNFKETLEYRHIVLQQNCIYKQMKYSWNRSGTHSKNLPTTQKNKSDLEIHSLQSFIIIIKNSKVHYVGKWLDNKKSLTARRNTYDQKWGCGRTQWQTRNICNWNKEVNEHLPKLSEVPRGKLKQKMSSSGKLVKCEKRKLYKQV